MVMIRKTYKWILILVGISIYFLWIYTTLEPYEQFKGKATDFLIGMADSMNISPFWFILMVALVMFYLDRGKIIISKRGMMFQNVTTLHDRYLFFVSVFLAVFSLWAIIFLK